MGCSNVHVVKSFPRGAVLSLGSGISLTNRCDGLWVAVLLVFGILCIRQVDFVLSPCTLLASRKAFISQEHAS